ncbi:asparagine synthase C-terminal domain-containing protein [Corynebacterium sp.]|uniref:asparagine synthase C-terminal domain-containing protein n=1 Tax=Corynebacterium sp. TaxID=1720 RepID=UPI0026E0905C|nr:asparagine synthase C-terminal domain-containing protein [Corynebacterium sp.]MDO5511998.1 asparagine synthase C-terminal domain-containing protein [Corynebacterium sp.]
MTRLDCEYVADTTDMSVPGTYDIADRVQAREEIIAFLQGRITAVCDAYPAPQILMLSGGIDSILVAAAAASLDRGDGAFVAMTLAHPGHAAATEELRVAQQVAALVGIPHEVIAPDAHQWRGIISDTVARLDNSDPWEVLAGATLVAVDRHARSRGMSGALITGAGADALFLGGGEADLAVDDWDEAVRSKVAANFTRDRFIPDFYERLLDDPARHIQVWQTREAYELALRIHPSVVRGGGVDKQIHREAAQHLGIPGELVRARKHAMQLSSGGVDTLVAQAREELARATAGKTYSDPREEDPEFLVARLWLREIHRRGRQ